MRAIEFKLVELACVVNKLADIADTISDIYVQEIEKRSLQRCQIFV